MWVRETPAESGWYWVIYQGKRGLVLCPCYVEHFAELGAVHVRTFRNDTFIEREGQPGLRYNGIVDESVRFGPKIEAPEEVPCVS